MADLDHAALDRLIGPVDGNRAWREAAFDVSSTDREGVAEARPAFISVKEMVVAKVGLAAGEIVGVSFRSLETIAQEDLVVPERPEVGFSNSKIDYVENAVEVVGPGAKGLQVGREAVVDKH